MSVKVLVKDQKSKAIYNCKPRNNFSMKCGKCLRGIIPCIDKKKGTLNSPVGYVCKVCSSKVVQFDLLMLKEEFE